MPLQATGWSSIPPRIRSSCSPGNKQAVNVGASELIFRAGTTWVRDAAVRLDMQPDQIVLVSGKALLIADTAADGRAVIQKVTERALREAPGLQVWGVVDPEPIRDDADRGDALVRAYRRPLHRSSRRPAVREPVRDDQVAPQRREGQAGQSAVQTVVVSPARSPATRWRSAWA